MKQATTLLTIPTSGSGFVEITGKVSDWIGRQGFAEGLLTLFIRHTSASLLIQENADPAVRYDLETFFRRLVPESEQLYRHQEEGPDDMPSHIRSALTSCQLSIPLIEGRLALGTWQGIYVFEHRRTAHRRQVALHLLGE